ncbi:MAG: glycosyltransferase family 9 protein [Acidobacteriota bacterium]|nr:glycosyltransferase family 9 protein [Acidobacteriota bacterium]
MEEVSSPHQNPPPASGAADRLSWPPPTLVTLPRNLPEALETLPALEALVASGRRLVLLASRSHGPLLRQLPGIEQVVEVTPSEEAMQAELRQLGCSEAILLEDSLDSAWLSQRLPIPQRWGYGGWLRKRLLASAVARPPKDLQGPRRLEPLLEALGVEPPRSWRPRLRLSQELLDEGRRLIQRSRATDGRPRIGLAPTTDLRRAPSWPWKRFAELAQTLRREDPGRSLILLGDIQDLWPVVRIHEETARFFPVLGPDLDLDRLAAILADLDLLVASECSVLYLAAALGVPTVALVETGRSVHRLPTSDELASKGSTEARPARERHVTVPGLRVPWTWKPRLGGIEVAEVARICDRVLQAPKTSPSPAP